MTEVDATFGQVVGCHLDGYSIAGKDTDPVFLHSAGRIGESFVPIVEFYSKASIRKQLLHRAFELDQIFLGQTDLLDKGTGAPRRPRVAFRPRLRQGANSPRKRGRAGLAQAHS